MNIKRTKYTYHRPICLYTGNMLSLRKYNKIKTMKLFTHGTCHSHVSSSGVSHVSACLF